MADKQTDPFIAPRFSGYATTISHFVDALEEITGEEAKRVRELMDIYIEQIHQHEKERICQDAIPSTHISRSPFTNTSNGSLN